MKTRTLLSLLLLSACDPPEESINLREVFVDQYPDDPFKFGCDLPSVDISEITPTACAIMLTACMDATIELCSKDLKACFEMQESCYTWSRDSCWTKVSD